MAETGQRPKKFTARDKMRCAQREASFRRNVYRKRVDAGRMKQEDAAREVALMEEIAADYGEIATKEEGG